MRRYSENSREYVIKKGYYNRDDKPLYLEIIKDAGRSMQNWEILELAAAMTQLYQVRDYRVCLESFIFSLKKISLGILVKNKAGELLGSLFATKQQMGRLFSFYYLERLLMTKDLPINIQLLCSGFLLYNLPGFLIKPIRVTSITRRKVTQQLISLFGQNELLSSRDWPHLSYWKKRMIRAMVNASIGGYKYLETKTNDMMKDGVLRNIYTHDFSNSGNNSVIPGDNGLSENDALFILNIIPDSMLEIKINFQKNDKLKNMKILQAYMEHFTSGALLENLQLIRRDI